MNVVILSPHFPYNQAKFCNHLHHLGVNVLGIDQVDFPPLNCSLKDYRRVSDLHNSYELIETVEQLIQRHGAIHRLESNIEYWLKTQADLRTRFNIPGIKLDQIHKIKRKSEMKKVFLEAGLPAARGRLIPTLESALELAKEVGYPAFIKPDVGVGSRGCVKINTPEDLVCFFQTPPTEDYIMEEYIEGTLCSFDGLIGREGNIIFCSSFICSRGLAEVVAHELDYYFYTVREIPSDLEAMGRKIVQAFDVHEGFFHFEFFRKHSDHTFIPIEVNIRAPGGGALDMYNYACDVDLYLEWAKVIAGVSEPFQYERKYYCLTATRRNNYRYRYSHGEILQRWGDKVLLHEQSEPINVACMGNYRYIVRSSEFNELMAMQASIQETC